ncbi:MAG: class I SAM-dependent methyltransferase [Chloroflexota bacterium]
MSTFTKILTLYDFSLMTKLRTYQRWYAGTPYEHVEQFVPKKGEIIDLGCGWGIFANLLALTSDDRNVYGIDLDKHKVSWAKKTLGPDRTNIQFRVQDIKDIELPHVQDIILYDVLHHLEEPIQYQILRECYQKLSKDGRLILKENDVVPRWKLFLSYLVEMIALGFNITLSSKILWRSRENWIQILSEIGFIVIHNEHIKTPYGFFVPHSLFVCKKI